MILTKTNTSNITTIVPTDFIINAIKNIVCLCIYWGIFYFIYNATFKEKEFALENVFGTIEFISAIIILICIFAFITNLTGTSFLGIILSLCILACACFYGDELMKKYQLSDNFIAYPLLAIGIIFNLILLIKLFKNIRYYFLTKNLATTNNLNANLDSYNDIEN